MTETWPIGWYIAGLAALIGAGMGLLSFVLGILCFYQKDDRHLKLMMVVMNLNHAFHFFLLNAITAAVSALLAVLRTGLSLKTSSPSYCPREPTWRRPSPGSRICLCCGRTGGPASSSFRNWPGKTGEKRKGWWPPA